MSKVSLKSRDKNTTAAVYLIESLIAIIMSIIVNGETRYFKNQTITQPIHIINGGNVVLYDCKMACNTSKTITDDGTGTLTLGTAGECVGLPSGVQVSCVEAGLSPQNRQALGL